MNEIVCDKCKKQTNKLQESNDEDGFLLCDKCWFDEFMEGNNAEN